MRILLMLTAVCFGSVAAAHSDHEGFSRVTSADCAPVVAGSGGQMQSLYISVKDSEAQVIAYNGPRNPIDFMKNSYASGTAPAYRMVGFPNNKSEAVVIRLGADLAKVLNRPQIVISAKILDPNSEIPSKGFLSNPMSEDEDIDMWCTMGFQSTDEDLDVNDPKYVQKTEHPSICTIQYRDDFIVKEWTHGCTASIAGEKKLLSAGHCEESFNLPQVQTRVRCGSNTEWISIAKWIKNPDYRPLIHPVDNTRDISIIELAKSAGGPILDIEYSATAIENMILNGAKCAHYGMGRRQDDTIGDLYTSEYAFPEELIGGRNYVERIFEMTNMIAGDPVRFMRNGDSGGPIICENEKGKSVIVGVHSFISLPSSAAFSAMPSRSAEFIQSLLAK